MNRCMQVCPICGGEHLGLAHKGTRDNDTISVYACYECGTKFLSSIDGNNDYENGFMYATSPETDDDIEKVLSSTESDDIRRVEMIKDICRNKKVLDFGCGYGGFLKHIMKTAYMCKGVELGRRERKYVNEMGITCFKSIDDYNERFDVITLFHVFEHLKDPKMWLEKYSNYLLENGYLIIEVPNANDALLSLYESAAFADFTYWSAHLFLYTVKSLSGVIEQINKFDIISAGQVQRYSIANHLMWLSKGLPGGHKKWEFLDTKELNKLYSEQLSKQQMCDTLFFVLQKRCS